MAYIDVLYEVCRKAENMKFNSIFNILIKRKFCYETFALMFTKKLFDNDNFSYLL